MREDQLAEKLAHLVKIADKRLMLAVDEAKHELLLLAPKDDRLRVERRHRVSHSPVRIAVSRDGRICTVTCLWARQVNVIEMNHSPPDQEGRSEVTLRTVATINLPFSPREQWLAADGQRLVVADSFGDKLGVIDLSKPHDVTLRCIPGHNVRGLCLNRDGDHLLISHQMINGRMPTQRERVFWGSVVGNVMREVALTELFADVDPEDVIDGAADVAHWKLHPMGRPGSATGDPSAVRMTSTSKTLVALSGVDEVAISPGHLQPFARRKTGNGPVAIAVDEAEEYAYVANKFDDSLTVIDLARSTTQQVALGRVAKPSLVQKGEILFYDARLSLDGWYSCHSCHTDGHTNGFVNDNFGDNSVGAPKRILSLLGAGETGPWAWSGERKDLTEQIRKSIHETMRGDEKVTTTGNIAALKAYVESLPTPPSLDAARGALDRPAIARGRNVFAAQGCQACHRAPTYTSPKTYDVGLEDEVGSQRFNPPSLRGVSQRQTFFHDGRALRLQDVFRVHRHPHRDSLPEADLKDLLRFLRSL